MLDHWERGKPILKGWWQCEKCGAWCGFTYRQYHIQVHRIAFCQTCDEATSQKCINYGDNERE